MGTITTQHAKGHVHSYRYTMEENVRGEVVEHVVVNSHPYELITRTCWQMDGAKDLAWPASSETLNKSECHHKRTAWPERAGL